MVDVESQVKTLAHEGAEALEEVGEVVATWIAPLVGFAFGWIFGPAVGGIFLLGNQINNVINSKNDANYYATINLIAGVGLGAIWGILGGCLWAAASKVKSKKFGLIGKALLGFFAGTAFGMAGWAVVTGASNENSNGFLDGIDNKLTSALGVHP